MSPKCLTPYAAQRPMRGRRRRSTAWRGESLERRLLLDAVGTLAAVPVTWSASDTSLTSSNITGHIEQAGEVDYYRFTTAEPARLMLQARPRGADPLDGHVKLLAVSRSQPEAHVLAADELSVGHSAAVDGWIAPGEYLVAVAADVASSQQAADAALGGYDLSLRLDRAAYTASGQSSGVPAAVSNSVFTSQGNVVTVSGTNAVTPPVNFLFSGGDNLTVPRNLALAPAITTSGGTTTSAPISPSISSPPPATSSGISGPGAVTNSVTSPTAAATAVAISSTRANFPAAAAPVSRLSGAGAAASLPTLGRAAASVQAASPPTASRASGLTAAADGSDSSQEGELEYAFRRAGTVLSRAIGGTLRQVRDAALVGLSEAVRFDVLGGNVGPDWFADALHVVLPAMPGGAALDAALERLDVEPVVPVSAPTKENSGESSAEAAAAEDISATSAGLVALALVRPVGERIRLPQQNRRPQAAHRSR
jgi:hypothetical protein